MARDKAAEVSDTFHGEGDSTAHYVQCCTEAAETNWLIHTYHAEYEI